MMRYKGFAAVARVDTEAGVIRGQVVNTRDVITFQGRDVAEARQAFHDSVDDYLAFCAERGEAPEKPFSGKFVVRIEPELHRALAIRASRAGVSLNALVKAHLRTAVRPGRAVGKSPKSQRKPKPS